MTSLPVFPNSTYAATLTAGRTPRSSLLPLPVPVKALTLQQRSSSSGTLDEIDRALVSAEGRRAGELAHQDTGEGDHVSAFEEEMLDTTDTANPYNLIAAERLEEFFSVGETFTDTTLSFVLSGCLNAEQVSHLNHLFHQTICCDLETCLRAGRSFAPGIYASPSLSFPASSAAVPALGSCFTSDDLLDGGGKRFCRRGSSRRSSSSILHKPSSSMSCWKLKNGKCLSFKREDAHARLLLKSATISTRGLVLSCRRPLIITDVNEYQCVAKGAFTAC